MLVDADVENMSDRAGDAVSELYLTPPAEPTSPRMALVGFDRLTLAPHAKQHVHFMVDARALSTVDADGARAVRSGDYVFHLGGTQPTDTSDGSMSAAFTIHGNEELPR
jgi:beta-glucosidase